MGHTSRYDIKGFAEELGLSVEDISDLYVEFVKELDSQIIKLKEAAEEEDWSKVKDIIHNIKGVSGNYRVNDVYNEASKINSDLKNDHYDDIKNVISNFCSLSEDASKELERYFSEIGN